MSLNVNHIRCCFVNVFWNYVFGKRKTMNYGFGKRTLGCWLIGYTAHACIFLFFFYFTPWNKGWHIVAENKICGNHSWSMAIVIDLFLHCSPTSGLNILVFSSLTHHTHIFTWQLRKNLNGIFLVSQTKQFSDYIKLLKCLAWVLMSISVSESLVCHTELSLIFRLR